MPSGVRTRYLRRGLILADDDVYIGAPVSTDSESAVYLGPKKKLEK